MDTALALISLILLAAVAFREIYKEKKSAERLSRIRRALGESERERNEAYRKKIESASRDYVLSELNSMFQAATNEDGNKTVRSTESSDKTKN